MIHMPNSQNMFFQMDLKSIPYSGIVHGLKLELSSTAVDERDPITMPGLAHFVEHTTQIPLK